MSKLPAPGINWRRAQESGGDLATPSTWSSSHFLHLPPILPTHSFPLSPAANTPAGKVSLIHFHGHPGHLGTTALPPKDICGSVIRHPGHILSWKKGTLWGARLVPTESTPTATGLCPGSDLVWDPGEVED